MTLHLLGASLWLAEFVFSARQKPSPPNSPNFAFGQAKIQPSDFSEGKPLACRICFFGSAVASPSELAKFRFRSGKNPTFRFFGGQASGVPNLFFSARQEPSHPNSPNFAFGQAKAQPSSMNPSIQSNLATCGLILAHIFINRLEGVSA